MSSSKSLQVTMAAAAISLDRLLHIESMEKSNKKLIISCQHYILVVSQTREFLNTQTWYVLQIINYFFFQH